MCCSPMFNHTHITLCSCIENMMYQRHMAVTWRVFVTEASDAELERVLLLVLGCAVQSDEREQFIENIRRLDVDVQRAIVDAIQQVCSVLHCNMHFLHVRFITNFPIVERLHKLLVLVLNDYRQTPYIWDVIRIILDDDERDVLKNSSSLKCCTDGKGLLYVDSKK